MKCEFLYISYAALSLALSTRFLGFNCFNLGSTFCGEVARDSKSSWLNPSEVAVKGIGEKGMSPFPIALNGEEAPFDDQLIGELKAVILFGVRTCGLRKRSPDEFAFATKVFVSEGSGDLPRPELESVPRPVGAWPFLRGRSWPKFCLRCSGPRGKAKESSSGWRIPTGEKYVWSLNKNIISERSIAVD